MRDTGDSAATVNRFGDAIFVLFGLVLYLARCSCFRVIYDSAVSIQFAAS